MELPQEGHLHLSACFLRFASASPDFGDLILLKRLIPASLTTGLFASILVNPPGGDGLLLGNLGLLGSQLTAAVMTIAYSFVVSFALLKLVDRVSSLRVFAEDEKAGLDESELGEGPGE